MRIIVSFSFFLFLTSCFSQEHKNVLNLFFSSNSSVLNKKAKEEIKNVFETAKPGEFYIEKIIGYCDSTGSESANKVLALKRINAVEEFIELFNFEVGLKIPSGENYPSDAKDLKKYSYWRRVEIHYTIVPPTVVIDEEIPSTINKFYQMNIDSLEVENSEPIVLNINFMPGMDVLLENSYPEIENLYQFLRGNENVFAFIRGHVCCADDYPLSSARAYVVYTALVNRGISPSRLKFQGFSNTIPAVSPEIIEEHRIKNRRVDVIFSLIP
jgi:outer membrane protein OmpA-like peptidoglycan-associated protein